jgi:heme-degrading monooxygenase HmoA
MYANWVTFNLASVTHQEAEEIAKSIRLLLEPVKGFKSALFLRDDESGMVAGLVTWETKEDADTAFQTITPRVGELMKGKVKEPPKRVLFEVLKA